MAESSPKDMVHKIVIIGGCGLVLLIEAVGAVFPSSHKPQATQEYIVEQALAQPENAREETNPKPSWLESKMCNGFKQSSILCKDYQSSRHPLLDRIQGN